MVLNNDVLTVSQVKFICGELPSLFNFNDPILVFFGYIFYLAYTCVFFYLLRNKFSVTDFSWSADHGLYRSRLDRVLLSILGKVKLTQKLLVFHILLLKLLLVGQYLFMRTYDLADGCILTHVKESMTSHCYMKKGIIHFYCTFHFSVFTAFIHLIDCGK